MGSNDAGVRHVRSQGANREGGTVGPHLVGVSPHTGGDVDGVVHYDPVHVLREGRGPGEEQGRQAVGSECEVLRRTTWHCGRQ